jgi:hypothetical protein
MLNLVVETKVVPPSSRPTPPGDRAAGGAVATRLCGLASGTRVLTPHGYRVIETLRRGDLVGAIIGRGPFFVPVQWVGRRAVTLSEPQAASAAARPVRIRRGAIADAMPAHDIIVAPEQAIYLGGSLFMAQQLVNGRSIVFEEGLREIEYWALQLERHDILVAENLPVESLLPAAREAFTEGAAPYLRAVAPADEPAGAGPAAAFPPPTPMPPRWFRRRLLRQRPPVRPATHATPAAAAISRAAAAQQDGGTTQQVVPGVPATRGAAAEPNAQPAPPPAAAAALELQAEAGTVLQAFAKLAAARGVHLELAVETGLLVRMHRTRLHELLGAMLTHAIHGLPGGRVLVGAMQHGGRVQIAVIDEEASTDRASQEADLRQAVQLAALQGATLEIDVRPGEGTTLLLRLPAA